MDALGWDDLDVLLVSGDAYVDHSSFGIVLLARLLIDHGYRTGLCAQPDWRSTNDLLAMGRPRLFAGIGAGAVDSLLAHYTAFRKKRFDDAYTPGGKAGKRPNRASIVYANLVRRAFPGLPLVLGGIESSTRRASHYDFWTDSIRRPILFDAKADLLVWGMGERAILSIANALSQSPSIPQGIPGTAWISALSSGGPTSIPPSYGDMPRIVLPSHEEVCRNKKALICLTRDVEKQVHSSGSWAYEQVDSRALILAPVSSPLTTEEMDALYALPFTRRAHPSYTEAIPAETMLRTSLTSHRGCGGGCSFCSLSMHQGRYISSRSSTSLLRETRELARLFPKSRRGEGLAISDVGGPTANMWMGRCARSAERNECQRVSCCFPSVCPFFETPQDGHVALLRRIAAEKHVRSVRVASGIRADLALREPEALDAYIEEFTGGQLKLAPEHCVPQVLERMHKPPLAVFERFLEHFQRQCRLLGRKQYIVPYLMSAFPGCTDSDMQALSDWLAERNWSPQQTQCFIPTPGTMATAMYYSGLDEQGRAIYVARTDAERLRQHRILMGAWGGDKKTSRSRKEGRGPSERRLVRESHRHNKSASGIR